MYQATKITVDWFVLPQRAIVNKIAKTSIPKNRMKSGVGERWTIVADKTYGGSVFKKQPKDEVNLL